MKTDINNIIFQYCLYVRRDNQQIPATINSIQIEKIDLFSTQVTEISSWNHLQDFNFVR